MALTKKDQWLKRRRPVLLPKEHEVMGWVVKGLTNQQIAEEMGITRYAVTAHLQHVFVVMGFETRVSAVMWYVRERVGEFEN